MRANFVMPSVAKGMRRNLSMTFALVLIAADAVRILWGADNKTGPPAPGLAGSVTVAGQLFPSYDFAVIVFGPLVALGLWVVFHRTRWGVLIRAATQDREMVAALGVDQSRLFTGVFVLGSFLAGLGAAVLIAVVAAVVSGVVDLQSKDVYQSHNGSVRVSAR